jgi:hypothetical protein
MDSSTNYIDLTAVDSPSRHPGDADDNPATPVLPADSPTANPETARAAHPGDWSDDSSFDGSTTQEPTTKELLVSLLQASRATASALARLTGEFRADREERRLAARLEAQKPAAPTHPPVIQPKRPIDVSDIPDAPPSPHPVKIEAGAAAPATPSASAKSPGTSTSAESLPTPPRGTSLAAEHAAIQASHRASLQSAATLYANKTSLSAAVPDREFYLKGRTIADILTWMRCLPKYAYIGGTLRWAHLIPRPTAKAIWERWDKTEGWFNAIANEDILDTVFLLVRPSNASDWSTFFSGSMKFAHHSASYESVATPTLRLTELSDFCERCTDVIYILGPEYAPEHKSVIHLFTRALPHDLYDLVNGAQINSYQYKTISTYLAAVVKFTIVQQEAIRQARAVTDFAARARPAPAARQTPPPASGFARRTQFGALPELDDSYGHYGPQDAAPAEPDDLLPEERETLEAHGLFALLHPTPRQATITPREYNSVKQDLDFPAELRYAQHAQPCWGMYNAYSCAQGDNCKFEHSRARVDAYVETSKRRAAYVANK